VRYHRKEFDRILDTSEEDDYKVESRSEEELDVVENLNAEAGRRREILSLPPKQESNNVKMIMGNKFIKKV
jgi:hypothetical protein